MEPANFIRELFPPGTPARLRMGELMGRFAAIGVPVSYQTVHAMIEAGTLPRPLKLAPRLYLFDTEECRKTLAKGLPKIDP